MADTSVAITAGTGTAIDTRTEATNGNHRQVVVLGDPATNAGVAPVDATNGLSVNVTNASLTVASHAVTNAGTFATQVTTVNGVAPAFGTGTRGATVQRVTIATDDSVPVTIASVPSHAVTNAGTFAVQNTAATPAGTNNIGDVDVLTVPADPFGANADAASATGSVSAKLRGIATALGVTALDLGQGTGGSRTLRVAIDSAQLDGSEYETVAASQTTQALGATGATGDYFRELLVIPATTSPGAIQIKDGSNSAITVFAGGASSVSNLVPFTISLGLTSTAGAWQVTTGANVSAVGVGNFT